MKEIQLDIFPQESVSPRTVPVEVSGISIPVKEVIKATARQGHPIVVAWSSGKDSTACLNLVLVSLAEMVRNCEVVPQVIILHADPLVENPAVHQHALSEIIAIKRYAESNGIDIRMEISKPALLSQWAVKVISGRNLPPLPGRPRDCTLDLKVIPMEKLKKHIFKELNSKDTLEPVTVVGTRFAESAGRRKRMEKRGETHKHLWRDKEGLKLSPVAHWSDDDLWQYLYECSNGLEECYGDLGNLIQLYMDGAREVVRNCSGQLVPCNTRFGCMVCTVGRDKSMEGMLAKGEKYSYLQSIHELQDFIKNTRFDFERRAWIGRSINDGYIAIGPDTYSPDMLADLLRYCLTIDAREIEAATKLHIEPRFQLISPEALIAIDAVWSQQGIHMPFEALRIYREICEGARYDVPTVPIPEQISVPKARYLYVGEGWENIDNDFRMMGIRNIMLEMTSESDSGCMGTKSLKDGRIVLDVETADSEFTIDAEAAGFILGFELDYLLDKYPKEYFFPRTTAYRYYTTMGALQFASGRVNSSDLIMRRTAWKESMGLFDMSKEQLLANTVSKEDMYADICKRKGLISTPDVSTIIEQAFSSNETVVSLEPGIWREVSLFAEAA